MPVVSNSSPLIALAAIERLDLLPALFKSVVIPPAVAQEITRADGEREAIALAMELRADLVILDDLPARRVAKAAGLNVIGAVGVLLGAKRVGLIDRLRPELDNLLKHSFFLSPQLYDEVLHAAGELDR